MVAVLIVEDDTEKLRRILTCLNAIEEFCSELIDDARDAVAAKRLMRGRQYDLLILDVNIPERADVLPTPAAGVALLKELLARDVYRLPISIVGLSGNAEALAEAGPQFTENVLQIIHYDAASAAWSDQLQRVFRRAVASKSVGSGPSEFGISVGVVTALETPELAAVRVTYPP